MACYSLDFNIISEEASKVDEKTVTIPESKDTKVIESLYEVSAITEISSAEIGFEPTTYQKCGMIRYKTENDRDKAFDEMVNRIKSDDSIKKGSYVQKHNCYHDEKPPKPCEVIKRFDK